jgi:hypothetical protein
LLPAASLIVVMMPAPFQLVLLRPEAISPVTPV